jgi:hypothetical protein
VLIQSNSLSSLVWCDMAEDVKIIGSFDGCICGEQIFPKRNASLIKFSTIIKLHPGWYEIKFIIDGEC